MWLHQHTCQEGLEKWQELHSVRLQYMIQLLELQCSVNGGNEMTGTFWEQLIAQKLKSISADELSSGPKNQLQKVCIKIIFVVRKCKYLSQH